MPTQQMGHPNVRVSVKPVLGLHPAGDQMVSETVAKFCDGGHVMPVGIGQQQIQAVAQLQRPIQVILCFHKGVLSVNVDTETTVIQRFCNQGSV
jgi:hypothetical protein